MNIPELIKELKKRKDLKGFVYERELPPSSPSYAEPERPLPKELLERLKSIGIERLYTHQARGIDLVREGGNAVVMTPAASGKSLVFNIPVIETLLEDPSARAIYIYPLKGLEQDQRKALGDLAGGLGIENLSEIYDGDTSAYRRKKIRETPPGVVLTNPDMLHLAINAFHEKWEHLFRNLKYVVIDEVHTYRGVFGSHVANVFRRLRRIAHFYGSSPTFIACSATIANPGELVRMLTGLDFEVIEKSGAPSGRRFFLFHNPIPEHSPYTIATKLFVSSVKAGFRTIAFTKARKITELMHAWARDSAPELKDVISSYRAGFLPEERREIERKLFEGELRGVISTSALELGVDIGGLDVCILVGYPGTISSTWQRSGRVGRKGRDSLVIMVALEDALDQYFMRNPDDFFGRSMEAAVLDSENPVIAKAHLLCAATERFLKADDRFFDVKKLRPILEELEREGMLRHFEKADIWYSRRKYPHREVSIREAGTVFRILDIEGRAIGGASSTRVFHELHPGAVYLHRGDTYIVTKLDISHRDVICRPAADLDYHTRAITKEDTEIISIDEKKEFENFEVYIGRLRVTEQVLGFVKKHIYTDRNLGKFPLDLPPQVFTTTGIWMEVDEDILDEINEKGFSIAGSLHALEHAAIATLPLYALCDRMDLGGVSYTMNPDLVASAIFIYDGHEGGVGLARRGFDCVEEWFSSTMKLMDECACEVSCPSCTQDPKCGSGNEPLDKRGAILILRKWIEK